MKYKIDKQMGKIPFLKVSLLVQKATKHFTVFSNNENLISSKDWQFSKFIRQSLLARAMHETQSERRPEKWKKALYPKLKTNKREGVEVCK